MFNLTFDSEFDDYPSRNCTACGTRNYCNMYGMHRCSSCGFSDRPHTDDNDQRAREWRDKNIMKNPRVEDANHLINEILDGEWDEYLQDIVNSVRERRTRRQQEVLSQVHEVFGPNATIQVNK